MMSQNLDEHVAKFERLALQGGYNLEDAAVKDIFGRSLPAPLFAAILTHKHPQSWGDWVEAAEKHQQIYLTLKSYFGNKMPGKPQTQQNRGNFPRRTQDQWRSAFSNNQPRDNRRDPNTMDTSAQIHARGISTEERESLMKEGKCINCRKTSHLSRFCPDFSPYQGPCPPYQGPSRARNASIEEVMNGEPPKDELPKVAARAGTTAEEVIDLIRGLRDEVKDQVIQKVFMPQDFS
jgi:hypothetical protein